MATRSLIWNSLYLLIMLFILGVYGVNIQLYKKHNFTEIELYLQSNSTADCNNISWDKKAYVKSIRTDTCFIAHFTPNCAMRSESKIYLPGETNKMGRWIESFHICSDEDGGTQLNVDITKNKYLFNVVTDVLESYKNVCSCVNVPQYAQNMDKWSFDNHFNDLLAYYEPDCMETMWNPRFVATGPRYESNDVHLLKKTDSLTNTTYKIQSFGPNPKSANFQISCNSSRVTTEGTKKYESTTKSVKDATTDLNEQIHGGTISIKDITTGRTDSTESTIDTVTDVDTDVEERILLLSTKLVKVEKIVDQSRKRQDIFQEKILKQQMELFNKFTETITELLQQGFQNFTDQIKVDLHELYA